jgi:CRISPR-associated protein Csx17
MTEPLGSYLKALGVLRLIAEQADPEALGRWEHNWFCLDSKLTAEELVEFFLKRYCPTPILTPWYSGSGFYNKNAAVGVEAIAQSADPRFRPYRETIEITRGIPEVATSKSGANSEDEWRIAIQLACRNRWPDPAVDWLDAAVGISAEGRRLCAPILGTGGNDGHLDFATNFIEHLRALLFKENDQTRRLLRNSLFGEPAGAFARSPVGQYDPGRAGGFNQGQEVETKDVPINRWNFVLTLEGAVAWAAGLYRRQGVAYRSFLCSPFTVRATPVGYSSAGNDDGSLSRAEIWTPIWQRPAGYREIKALLREGRATIDGKPARNGLEFAQAATMLGVDRGISGFVRYNLVMRRGKSYIALPAGRFPVDSEPRQDADLIRQLSVLLEEADWRLKDFPKWYGGARRQIDEAMYGCLLRGGADGLSDTAAATGRWLRLILNSGRPAYFGAPLSGAWVTELAKAPEGRIAAALAGIWQPRLGGFRDHLERAGNRYSWIGRDLPEKLTATLERRVLAAEQDGIKHNALRSRYLAGIGDAIRFLEESLDDNLIEDLLFFLTLVDWKQLPFGGGRLGDDIGVWPIYALLKHLFLTSPIPSREGNLFLAADLNVVSALRAGDIPLAAQTAIRRLENAGLVPPDAEFEAGFDGVRLAASLLIPVPYGAALKRFCERGELSK